MAGLLTGKNILITGASRGIGRASALLMAEEGANVVVHYRRQRAMAEAVAEQVAARGRQALLVQADLEQPEAIAALFADVARAWGRLDVVVANAAATAFKPAEQLQPYHLERTYRVVVGGFLELCRQAAPLMPPGGRLLAVSSIGSRYALPRYAALGSAKAALEAMVRYVAAEWGPRGITCNAVCPGVVETDSSRFYADTDYERFRAQVIARTPLGRLAEPKDVANFLVLLASDRAGFLNGQVVLLDGGAALSAPGFEEL